MIKTNYHTHNCLCDGKEDLEAYIVSATEKGFEALGFSSHAPLPVQNDWTLSEENLSLYLMELDRMKNKWKSRLQIYKALEIDYIKGFQAPRDARWVNLNLDYMIGSVHTTVGLDQNPQYRCVDGPLDELHWLIDTQHGGSAQTLCDAYYTRIVELVRLGGFDILGHFDLIKKWNRSNELFTESVSWYRDLVLHSLDVIAGSRIMVEVNSGAIARNILDEVYPSPWILAEALKRNIPVLINADAHHPKDIDCHYEESWKLLQEIGFRQTWALLDNRWTPIPLK